MPKLIDYPRTTYSGAWEVAEITDDTGGKCAIETAARKLNRKVSGSFKAIIGSAVKFGLLTSKRDVLTTTTLFKRIKHAYDKQEELAFHREAFLTPPLFTQLCRKFRSRELPVQMLDVMLIREFGVEEINAQGVSKAFTEGCRMVGLLNENNIMADIDALNAQRAPRREIASPIPSANIFRSPENTISSSEANTQPVEESVAHEGLLPQAVQRSRPAATSPSNATTDAIASLFGLANDSDYSASELVTDSTSPSSTQEPRRTELPDDTSHHNYNPVQENMGVSQSSPNVEVEYRLQVSGPGVNSNLSIVEEEDIAIAVALLEKIRRQLRK
jgi:hypothetical protein